MAAIWVSLKPSAQEDLEVQLTDQGLEIWAGDRWLAPLLEACACTMPQSISHPLNPADDALFHLAELLQHELQSSSLETYPATTLKTSPQVAAIARILTIYLLRISV